MDICQHYHPNNFETLSSESYKLYLGEIDVRVFTVHTEEIPHKGQTQRSWRIIWWIPVFDKICYKKKNENKQKQTLKVQAQQKLVQPHGSRVKPAPGGRSVLLCILLLTWEKKIMKKKKYKGADIVLM